MARGLRSQFALPERRKATALGSHTGEGVQSHVPLTATPVDFMLVIHNHLVPSLFEAILP